MTAVPHPAAGPASAYGLYSIIVDGNDPEAVYQTALERIARARAGEGPALVEAKTYRKGGHSRADPAKYRPEDEVRAWLARDPVDSYRKRLLDLGIEESVLVGIENESLAKVDEAEAEARAAPPPDPSIAETNLWSDGGSAWRR